MKTFSQVWIEEDNGDNGHYECKLHDKEDCPYCTDVSVEKPLSWGIAGRKTPLDEVMERLLGKKDE